MKRAEVRGRRGERKAGKGAGASSHGPRRSRLPSRLRSAPPLSPAPTPPRTPPQRRVRGNTLLGDFWYPSGCAAYALSELWRLPASSPFNLACLPTNYALGPGRSEDPLHASAVPKQRPRSQGDLDLEGHAPAGTARTCNLCTKGRHSKGRSHFP